MINAIYYPYVNTRAPERHRHTWRKIDCTVCAHAEGLVFSYFIADICAGGFSGIFLLFFYCSYTFLSHTFSFNRREVSKCGKKIPKQQDVRPWQPPSSIQSCLAFLLPAFTVPVVPVWILYRGPRIGGHYLGWFKQLRRLQHEHIKMNYNCN